MESISCIAISLIHLGRAFFNSESCLAVPTEPLISPSCPFFLNSQENTQELNYIEGITYSVFSEAERPMQLLACDTERWSLKGMLCCGGVGRVETVRACMLWSGRFESLVEVGPSNTVEFDCI